MLPRPPFRSTAAALATALALAGLLSLAAPRPSRAQEAPLEVVASILPLADFVREVGGARVHVTLLVPPGQNPHAFAMKPSQAVRLHHARLLVLNGLGLEFWADSLVASLDPSRIRVLRLGDGLKLQPRPADAAGRAAADDDAHGGVNPHVWLDPVLAQAMVREIRDALAALDPPHAAQYRSRAEDYLAKLGRLDADYRRELEDLPQKTFLAFHAGYEHLARRYGLTEVAVMPGFGEGMEPSPARVAEVIRTAKRLHARAIFAEPQFPLGPARLIAAEAAIELAILDPIGLADDVTYLGLMRENLRQLVHALQ